MADGSALSRILAGTDSKISLICCCSWSSELLMLVLPGLPGSLGKSYSINEDWTGVRGDSSPGISATVGMSLKLTESDLVLDRNVRGELSRLRSSLGIASRSASRIRGSSGLPCSS